MSVGEKAAASGGGNGGVIIGGLTNNPEITPKLNTTPSKPSLPMVHALRALLTGGGIGLPGGWTSVGNFLNSAASFTGQLNRIVNSGVAAVGLYNLAKNNLPGVAMMVGGGIISKALKDGGVDENNIVISSLNRAQQLFKDPLSFLKVAAKAQTNAEANFGNSATVGLLGVLGNVGNLLLGAKTLTDLVTGGISSSIGPGAENTIAGQRIAASGIPLSANDVRTALAAVAAALRGFGTLYSSSDPTSIGTPIGLINSLRDQGIADQIDLNAYLKAAGLDPAVDLALEYSPVDLKDALATVTGDPVKYVIETTQVTIWAPAFQVQSLADLLNPYVVLPESALEHIPGATLENFGQAIAGWGITNNASWYEIATILDNLIVPDCPDINHVNLPSFYASLGPYVPSGSGLFGQANVKDFIGTVGGHVHQDACNQLYSASQVLQNSEEGKQLKAAMDYFDLHPNPGDPLYNYAVSQMQLAMQNLASSSNPSVQAAIHQSNTSMLDSALQIVNEVENYAIMAGAALGAVEGLYDAGTVLYAKIAAFVATSDAEKQVDNKTEVDKTIQSVMTQPGDLLKGISAAWEGLTTILKSVTDALGLGDLLNNMITNDPQGQAIRAALAEAQNKALLGTLGVSQSRGTLDYQQYAQVLQATRGFGLTPLQIRIISTDAILRGYSVQDMLAINSLYGYDHQYYDALQFS